MENIDKKKIERNDIIMKYLKEVLKKTGWMSILESVIFTILGIILVCKPEGTVKIISGILGVTFIIIGIYKIINYFMTREKNDFFNYELIYGLTAIVIGIVIMAYMDIIGSIFRIVIGIWIIYTSFVRINSTIQIKKIGNGAWIYSLILSIIMFICGLYVLINSNAIIVTIGAIMIVYSVIDIIENIIFMKNVKELL